MSSSTTKDEIDELLHKFQDECAHQFTRDKYYDEIHKEAKQALLSLIAEERLDELNNLPRSGFIGSDGLRFEVLLHTSIDNRKIELQALRNQTGDKS